MSRRHDPKEEVATASFLARQTNAVHDAAKPDVREDGDLTPANQQRCKRSFALPSWMVSICSFSNSAPPGSGVQRRPRRSIGLEGSVALAPWLGSPERPSRWAFNWRMSAARRRGSGIEMTSAKAVRNPPASVNGNFIRSNGTLAGRRIATGSSTKNVPRALYLVKCASGGFVRPDAPNGSLVNCAITF
jgi:hypothetical protein